MSVQQLAGMKLLRLPEMKLVSYHWKEYMLSQCELLHQPMLDHGLHHQIHLCLHPTACWRSYILIEDIPASAQLTQCGTVMEASVHLFSKQVLIIRYDKRIRST